MRRMKRLAALFLAAVMLLTLVGVRPVQAAEKYTVSLTNVGSAEAVVKINGKTATSLQVEAGKKSHTITSKQAGGVAEIVNSDPSYDTLSNQYGLVYQSGNATETGVCTLSFTMPAQKVSFQYYSTAPLKDLGSRTIDLRKGKVTISGEDFEPFYGFLSLSSMTEQFEYLNSGPDGAEINLDKDGAHTPDVKMEVDFGKLPGPGVPMLPESGKFYVTKLESSSISGSFTVVLPKEIFTSAGIPMVPMSGAYSSVTFIFSGTVSLAKATVSVKDQTYTGKALTPALTVKLDGLTLKKGEDYTVTYKNNTNAGTATVTIKGKAPYFTGSVSKTFKISPAQISKATVGALKAAAYTGKAQTPAPMVKFGGKTLKKGTDYTISYKNNTNAGTATVTIKGKGNFTGSVNKTFAIKPVSLKTAKISGLMDQLYTGKALKPAPVVKIGTKTLKAGTDYTVKYAQNTNVGTAKVTITGKGNYVGSTQATFKIMDPVEEFLARLYRVCLDREPEARGHAWWVAGLRGGGENGGSCAWGFFDSTEFKNHKYSNSAFLDHAYLAFFDRKPDAAGKNYWLGEMKKGMTREQVIKSGFAVSNEWKALCKTYQIKP